MIRKSVISAFLLGVSVYGQSQLVVNGTMTPEQLVQNVLLGGGVTASNITFNGGLATAINAQVGSFTAPVGTNLELTAGIVLSSGNVQSDPGNFIVGADGTTADFASNLMGGGSDPDLELLSGQEINDKAALEFDFIPTGDSLQFKYVFGSEEYPSYTCSDFNDAFGFFLSGPGIAGPYSGGAVNIALVPGTTVPVSINTLNSGVPSWPGDEPNCAALDPNWESNSVYFVDNAAQTGTIVTYDGFTVVLTAFALVQCGQTYHIKLAIGDGFDESFDSGVFLEAGSFTSSGQVIPTLTPGPGIVGNTINEGCAPVEITFTRQGDLSLAETVDIVVSGSATPGVDYSPAFPAQLDFAAEDSTVSFILEVPLDADGPENLIITIHQLIACAGSNVETEFTFQINSPDPLQVVVPDVGATCGDVNILAPVVTGGVGQYQYAWSTGDTTASITVSPAVTTPYVLTVSDGCSVAPVVDTVWVTLPVYNPLEITVTPATQVPCLGTDTIEVLSVMGGNGDYTFAWSAAGVPLGTAPTLIVPSGAGMWYHVLVSEGCGTSVDDSVYVSMEPLDPIVVTTTPEQTVICIGDSATVEIVDVTGGNGVYTQQWTDAQGTVVGTGTSIEVQVNADASYTVSVADQCGTQGVAVAWVRVPHYAPFELDLTPHHLICAGDSTAVAVVVSGGSGYYRIEWVEPPWTDPVLAVAPLETTTYHVSVSDQCGEVLGGHVVVTVEAPLALITTENLGQDDWHLRAATVPQALTHVWDMGDGTRYRHEHVFHSYMDLEDHWVHLKTTTPNGCMASDSVLLKPPAHVYFPNAFSPDGDGHNEVFGPIGHDITDYEIQVFNRWGELMYASTVASAPWTGAAPGGGDALTGVYVYKYRVSGLHFPSTEGMGHVTLLRGTQD